MKKEEWINAVLQSVHGQAMAEPNAFLHTRVMELLNTKHQAIVSYKWVVTMFAGMAMLLFVNVKTITNKNTLRQTPAINTVIQDYGLNDGNFYSIIN